MNLPPLHSFVCRATVAAVVSLAMFAPSTAVAEYVLTTTATGNGNFSLWGQFYGPSGLDGPEGSGTFTANMTTRFDIDNWWSTDTHVGFDAGNAAFTLELTVNGATYSTSTSYADVRVYFLHGGTANVDSLLYEISYTPPTGYGDYADIHQRAYLMPELLPVTEVTDALQFGRNDFHSTVFVADVTAFHDDMPQPVSVGSAIGTVDAFTFALAVPEPHTYTLTLLGCVVAAAGAAMRKQRPSKRRLTDTARI
ncbi:hypothetical protein OU994_24455 [Pseudoduganella sp. SL102]|uniref:hypothetical protein n=1 Tax=Pseudoduganella sp. SL102 TaxID=2995154 RepID=UPI00248B07C9|nr:hypothetical protein [Pseudoduganella sp. SL102]WBS01401.1 hypothetical protein OU994_24455 [Pseudoduganella sp. SL102]